LGVDRGEERLAVSRCGQVEVGEETARRDKAIAEADRPSVIQDLDGREDV
jgi:hypothetical protein